MSHSKEWDCKILFNESPASSKVTKVVDLLQCVIETNDDYMFPSRFNGLKAKKQLIVELKLACIQAGFTPVVRTVCKGKKFSETFTIACQQSLCYQKKNIQQKMFEVLIALHPFCLH